MLKNNEKSGIFIDIGGHGVMTDITNGGKLVIMLIILVLSVRSLKGGCSLSLLGSLNTSAPGSTCITVNRNNDLEYFLFKIILLTLI